MSARPAASARPTGSVGPGAAVIEIGGLLRSRRVGRSEAMLSGSRHPARDAVGGVRIPRRRQALPNAELVYLRRASHNAYQDQPAAFLAVVRAFLAGWPLPIAPWTGSAVLADYEGPHGHPTGCADRCPDGR